MTNKNIYLATKEEQARGVLFSQVNYIHEEKLNNDSEALMMIEGMFDQDISMEHAIKEVASSLAYDKAVSGEAVMEEYVERAINESLVESDEIDELLNEAGFQLYYTELLEMNAGRLRYNLMVDIVNEVFGNMDSEKRKQVDIDGLMSLLTRSMDNYTSHLLHFKFLRQGAVEAMIK